MAAVQTDLEMLRNGVSIATIETGSNTQGVPNMAVFAEMAVETATVSTEERGSGVRLNFIPREGGNTFSGLVIALVHQRGDGGRNFTHALQDRGLRTPNNLKASGEVNGAYGRTDPARPALVLRNRALQSDAELGRGHVRQSERIQPHLVRVRSRSQPAGVQ